MRPDLCSHGPVPFEIEHFVEPPPIAETGKSVSRCRDGKLVLSLAPTFDCASEENDPIDVEQTQCKHEQPDEPGFLAPIGIDGGSERQSVADNQGAMRQRVGGPTRFMPSIPAMYSMQPDA